MTLLRDALALAVVVLIAALQPVIDEIDRLRPGGT